jgi:hypothetical protein
MIGSLSSWLIGTSVMAAAVAIQSAFLHGSLKVLILVIFAAVIIQGFIFPGALVVGGAAGCLALATARSLSPRGHTAGFALLGAVVGVVYAHVRLSSESGFEESLSWLCAEAGISGAVAGAVMSMLVRKRVRV